MTELGEHGKSRKIRACLGNRPKEEMVADDKHIIKEQIRRHVKNQHPSPHKSVGEGVYQYKRRKHDEFNEGGCTCRDGQIADIFYLPKRLGSGGTREDLMMKGGGPSRPLKKIRPRSGGTRGITMGRSALSLSRKSERMKPMRGQIDTNEY